MATKQKYSNETMYEVLNQAMKNLSDILVEHNDNIKSLQGKTIPIDTKPIEQCSFDLKKSKEGLEDDIRVLEDDIKVLEGKIKDLKSIKIEPIDTTSLDNFIHILNDYRTKIEKISDTNINEMEKSFSNAFEITEEVFERGNDKIKSTLENSGTWFNGSKGKKFLICLWILTIVILVSSGIFSWFSIKTISEYEKNIQEDSALHSRIKYLEEDNKLINDYFKENPKVKKEYENWKKKDKK